MPVFVSFMDYLLISRTKYSLLLSRVRTCCSSRDTAPSGGTQGHGDLIPLGCGHLCAPSVVCEGDWRDARPRSEGPADASGGIQANGWTSGADSGRAEAGRLPPPIEGARDVCHTFSSRFAFLQSKTSHWEEPGLQTAAKDAQRWC